MAESPSKFRSLGAFKSYTQRAHEPPSPTRVLQQLKRHGGSATLAELADDMALDAEELRPTVDRLIELGQLNIEIEETFEDSVLSL